MGSSPPRPATCSDHSASSRRFSASAWNSDPSGTCSRSSRAGPGSPLERKRRARRTRASSCSGSALQDRGPEPEFPLPVAVVAGGHRRARQQLRLRRDQPRQEALHLGAGQGAGELVHGLAVHERDHLRDAPDAELLRKGRVLVGVDLGPAPTSLALARQLLQHGAQLAAGPHHGAPEVHHDGDVLGALQDLGGETGLGDVMTGSMDSVMVSSRFGFQRWDARRGAGIQVSPADDPRGGASRSRR